MRALISLYRQAETFITPENLSERIDSVFTSNELLSKAYYPSTNLDDLKILVRERRVQAKFTENDGLRTTNAYKATTMGADWDESKAVREQRVIDALYGVSAGGKPGLEVLEESAERIHQNLAEDLKQGRLGVLWLTTSLFLTDHFPLLDV